MKKTSIAIIAILALVTIFTTCKKVPEVNLKYVDVEHELITAGTTTATVQCDYEYIATLKKAYFYYGEGTDTINTNTAEMRVVQNTLYVDLVGLKESTTYSYFYEFHNGFNSMRSSAKTFKTEGSGTTVTLPTVVTAEVTEITTSSAKCGGEVTNDGGAEVTERGICWSTNENPTVNDNHIAVGSGTGAFTAIMSNLEANTSYHVRAYAINEAGTVYGLDKGFTTLSGGGNANLPSVVTNEVTGVTTNSAQFSGEVTSDGGAEVTERGFCWSTNANPSLSDNHVASGSGTGVFTYRISGLTTNTTYHVRAYATNEVGTVYGLDKEFTTLSGGGGGSGDVPTGAINGLFSLCDGRQVCFSQGNLQYQASTNTWRFAEKQWDYVGGYNEGTVYENGVKCDNNMISSTYSGWIDLFGWGTSGWNNGNIYYQPYDSENNYVPEMGWGYGPTNGTWYNYSLTGIYANADWGVYNAISNGGNMPNQWRTLTGEEWACVFEDRSTPSGIRYAKAVVNDVNGVILLPDDWDVSVYSLNNPNASAAPYYVNRISIADWGIMESHGAVFLSAAGCMESPFPYSNRYGFVGQYWSSSACLNSSPSAYYVHFNASQTMGQVEGYGKYYHRSVRLVHDVTP